ncbi:hypothetical protein GS19_07445 [Acinetobacter idrijaensis]|nr:hypothetical protein GS19_07445 [Acinetobacter idrijaensis]
MTTLIQTDVLINNPKAPYITIYDPIESREGSLFLWDAGKQKLSSIPAIGEVLPNLLSAYSPTSGFVFSKGTASDDEHNSYLKRELSSKGGIHLIASQSRATNLGADTHFGIKSNGALSQALTTAIMGANPNIYFSFWSKTTRSVQAQVGAAPIILYRGSGNNMALTLDTSLSTFQVNAVKNVSRLNKNFRDSSIVGVENFHQTAIAGYIGAGITAANTFDIFAGSKPPFVGESGKALNTSPSIIIYRVYIEDLTKSGRTFEQVKLLDDMEFEKAFAAGGRFNGDTWSNPSVVLP